MDVLADQVMKEDYTILFLVVTLNGDFIQRD